MENINVLIYSAPKTAGNTLQQTLIYNGLKVYYTHSKSFFEDKFPGQNNIISLNEYIQKESKNKKLTIITIFREDLPRMISSFFESFQYIHDSKKNIEDYEINDLINIFNDLLYKKTHFKFNIINGFFELFPEEIKNFKFDHSEKYGIWENNNIRFIVLRYRDINKWPSILSNILNINIKNLVNENFTENKKYNNKYKEFIKNYRIPIDIYNKFIKDSFNIEMELFLTKDEKKTYIDNLIF
jgi:hypothetical protein